MPESLVRIGRKSRSYLTESKVDTRALREEIRTSVTNGARGPESSTPSYQEMIPNEIRTSDTYADMVAYEKDVQSPSS